MTIHVNTVGGIQTVKEVKIKTADFPAGRKVQSGWMCTSTDYDGVPDEFKKIFSAISTHPSVTVEYVPKDVAVSMGLRRIALIPNNFVTAGIIRHPMSNTKFIFMKANVAFFDVTMEIGIYDSVTKTITSAVSHALGKSIPLDQITPFVYEINGSYFLTFYAGLENASESSLNRINGTDGIPLRLFGLTYNSAINHPSTAVADTQTWQLGPYVQGDIFNGMPVYGISLNAISQTNKKLFDPASTEVYLGPTDLPLDVATTPNSPTLRADKLRAISRALGLVTNYDVNPNTTRITGRFLLRYTDFFAPPVDVDTVVDFDDATTQGRANLDNLTYTPYNPGVTGAPLLWANTKFMVMPGFRSTNICVGEETFTRVFNYNNTGDFTSLQTDTFQDHNRFLLDKNGLHGTMPVNRNGSTSEAHLIYVDDRPYIAVVAYSRVAQHPTFANTGTETRATRNSMAPTDPNAVPHSVSLTIYDLINAHNAYVGNQANTISWKDIVSFHSVFSVYQNSGDLRLAINDTKNNPASGFSNLRGFKSNISLRSASKTYQGKTGQEITVDLVIHGLTTFDGTVKPVVLSTYNKTHAKFYKLADGTHWHPQSQAPYPETIESGDYSKALRIGGTNNDELRASSINGYAIGGINALPYSPETYIKYSIGETGHVFGSSTPTQIGKSAVIPVPLFNKGISESESDISVGALELSWEANSLIHMTAHGVTLFGNDPYPLFSGSYSAGNLIENDISSERPLVDIDPGVPVDNLSVVTTPTEFADARYINWIYGQDIRPENAVVPGKELSVTFALMLGDYDNDEYAAIISVDLNKAFDVVS